VNVTKLCDKALGASDIVIVIAGLPERHISCNSLALLSGLKGDFALQHLHRSGQHSAFWLAQKKVNVFRHDDIAKDADLAAASRLLKREQK
jgi:hypothetical protein